MKLLDAKVTNFRSIDDSGLITFNDLTCLVGKNEAGKTALLLALYGLNPMRPFSYNKVRDYPRRYLNKFADRHPTGYSEVIETHWELSLFDEALLAKTFGANILRSKNISISAGIGGKSNRYWFVDIDEQVMLKNLQAIHKLSSEEVTALSSANTLKDAHALVNAVAEKSAAQQAFLAALSACRDFSPARAAIDVLEKRLPKFFYTSHYERMSGEISLTKLATDKQNNKVSAGDQIFLDFIEYAGTSIQELQNTKKYEELKAQCEGASNEITDEIFQFWSQNEALAVKIELAEGRTEDEAPFNSGTVAKIRIENQNHRVTVPLSERSAGFVWFFSFLSQFKQLRKVAGNAIILLDEPGLTLHGKAQSDLLQYIQNRLLPSHQVIYSTHSPFMVPGERLADVRVVEDEIKIGPNNRKIVNGTKVSANILSVDKDTIFPLQGHLGYEITQSLFIGKNTLLVEGPSDILYLSVFSEELKRRGRVGLDSKWTICPTGGIDKIWAFASLFGGNKLNIAVLCDYGPGDKKKIERLRSSEILSTSQVRTAAEFSGKDESDIEDLFDASIYLNIVNSAFELKKPNLMTVSKLGIGKSDRLIPKVADYFRTLPAPTPEFNHYTPAQWLLKNPQLLTESSKEMTETLARFETAFNVFNKMIA